MFASAGTLHSDDRNPEICLCVSRCGVRTAGAGTLKLGGVIDVEDDDGGMEWNGTLAWNRGMEWQTWNTVHGHGMGMDMEGRRVHGGAAVASKLVAGRRCRERTGNRGSRCEGMGSP